MGSKGARPRNPEHSRHLPKVGTATENAWVLREEREAVLDQMGVGRAGRGVKTVVVVVVVILVVGALLGFTAVVIFR